MANMPKEGDKAPDFELPTDGGGRFKLSEQHGSPVVIYFYPKDDTSGCTLQAIGFTERKSDFDQIGVRIVGISPNSPDLHDKFKEKHQIGVTLASDEAKDVLEAYGVWGEKSMYGRKFMGVIRSTVLVDRDGRVVRAWRDVKVPGHIDEVLEAARLMAQ